MSNEEYSQTNNLNVHLKKLRVGEEQNKLRSSKTKGILTANIIMVKDWIFSSSTCNHFYSTLYLKFLPVWEERGKKHTDKKEKKALLADNMIVYIEISKNLHGISYN